MDDDEGEGELLPGEAGGRSAQEHRAAGVADEHGLLEAVKITFGGSRWSTVTAARRERSSATAGARPAAASTIGGTRTDSCLCRTVQTSARRRSFGPTRHLGVNGRGQPGKHDLRRRSRWSGTLQHGDVPERGRPRRGGRIDAPSGEKQERCAQSSTPQMWRTAGGDHAVCQAIYEGVDGAESPTWQ